MGCSYNEHMFSKLLLYEIKFRHFLLGVRYQVKKEHPVLRSRPSVCTSICQQQRMSEESISYIVKKLFIENIYTKMFSQLEVYTNRLKDSHNLFQV